MSIDKIRIDLDEATEHLGRTWCQEDKEAIASIVVSLEATIRALSSLALLVESK